MGITFGLTENSTEITIADVDTGEKETMDLVKVPNSSSLLVLEMEKDLLGRLNPTVLFNNLSTCADLFGIAYNAVNGLEGLQSSVWTLRQKLIKAATDSANDYVNGFINKINKVPAYYSVGVRALISNPIDKEKAKAAFAAIAKEAECISTKSKELVDLFQQLSNDAGEVAKSVIAAKALDLENKKKLEDNVADLQAKLKGLNSVQEELESEINDLSDQYKKLSQKIDKAENQAFWMGITSAITSTIGVGLSAYVSTTTAGIANTVTKNITGGGENTSAGNQSETVKNTQKSLEDTNKKISEVQAKIDDINKQIEEKDKAIASESDSKKKEELKNDKTSLVNQKDQEESNLKDLNSAAKNYSDVIDGICAGMKDISGKLDAQGQKMEDTVSALTEMADNISAKKIALNKEKRDVLQKIAEYTATVEYSVASKNSLGLAIAALSAGIGAMNYIVSVLNDFYTFWTRIKSYCENLADDNTGILIDWDTDEQLRDIEFLSNVATNACQWVALKLVLIDYQNAFRNIYDKLQTQLKEDEDPNPEVMWQRAISRSKGMSALIKAQAEGL